MRIAAVQMNSTPDKARNLSKVRRFIREAVKQKTDLVAFPENFSIFPENGKQLIEEAETLNSLTVQSLQEWAAELGIWILAGSLPLKKSAQARRVTNTSLLIASTGEIAARYDKIHLFDATFSPASGERPYHESKYTSHGKKIVAASTPLGGLGLSICYDLRFPELYRAIMKARHCDVRFLFVPSAFTAETGKAHWDLLTRARAVENQAFLIAPAQVGSPFPGRQTYGHTRIVDPWGKVIAEKKSGEGLVVADLDLEKQDRIRQKLPALANRRL